MSKIALQGNASGAATFTLQPPATNTNRTLVLPDRDDTVATIGDILYPFRNKLINGNFDIWQRGDSFTLAQYTADRWYSGNTGSTKTASKQLFTLGQTEVPGNPTYFMRHVVNSVAGADNTVTMFQAIESVRTLAGKKATLSFYAKADSNKNIAVDFAQAFGIGGTPSSTIVGIGAQLIPITTSWKKYAVTVDIPNITGKTLGTNNDCLYVSFWFDAGSNLASRTANLGQQSGTFDIAQVQVEEDSVATPFEERPIETELALCQRYYEKSYGITITPGTNSTGSMLTRYLTYTTSSTYSSDIRGVYKVTKRNIPTVTLYSTVTGASGKIRDVNAGVDLNASMDSSGVNGFRAYYTLASSQTVINIQAQFTSDAEL